MTELYICDTPFQTFNVLNIAYNREKNTDDGSEIYKDLYIINQFDSAREISKRLAGTGLFRNIYLLRKDDTKFLPVSMKRHLKMSLDFLNPRAFLKKRFEGYDFSQIDFKHYDVVYGSGAYSTVAAIMKLNPDADFILYEDGLGPYSDESIDALIKRTSGGKLNRLFCDTFHVGSYVCKPEKMLVNNVSACKCAAYEGNRVQPLPAFTEEFLGFSNGVFDVVTDHTGNDKNSYDFCWLSQPFDCNPGAAEVRDLIRDVLMEFRDEVCVRMHPRDRDADYYSAFRVDRGKDLWELSVLNRDADRLVLMGAFSNAQVTPKLLFDLEPILIFMHLLNDKLPEANKAVIEEEINGMRRIYSDPDRIYKPSTSEELREILNSLKKDI